MNARKKQVMWGQAPPAVRGAQLRFCSPASSCFSLQALRPPPFLPESGVSRAGSGLARKCTYALPPEIFSATIFRTAGAPKESQTTMSSTKHKLRLAGAFAALATLALAVSCTGFFPPEQIGTITITPATPTVPLGNTLQLSAYGTNTDTTSAGNITGKVTWTSDSGTVSVTSGGLLMGNDLSTTPATITATYQAVTATASATVCLESGTNFQIAFVPSSTVTAGTLVDISVSASVSGTSGVDVTSGVQWSTNNTSLTITSGDPATLDTSPLDTETTSTIVVVMGTYTCNGVPSSFQSNLTVEP